MKTFHEIRNILFNKEGKAYGPTGIAYSVPKGHPDEVDPRTRKKYKNRQTDRYRKQWAKKSTNEWANLQKMKNDIEEKPYLRTDRKLKNLKVPVKRKSGKMVKTKKEEMGEDAPANSVAGGGVDLTPGIKKTDNRHKYSIGKMFRRNNGVK